MYQFVESPSSHLTYFFGVPSFVFILSNAGTKVSCCACAVITWQSAKQRQLAENLINPSKPSAFFTCRQFEL
jgi:hypothetical protein